MSVNFNPIIQRGFFRDFGLLNQEDRGIQHQVTRLFHPFINYAARVQLTLYPPIKTELDNIIDQYVNSGNIEGNFDQVKGVLLQAFPIAKQWQIPQFSKIFRSLSDERLNILLKELFLQEGNQSIAPLIDRLTKVLSLQKIESTIRSEFPLFGTVKQAVNDISGLSGPDLELKSKESRQSLIRLASIYLINGIDQAAEMLLYVFNIKESSSYGPCEQSFRAQSRYYAMRNNFELLTGWFLGLSVLLDSKWKAIVVLTLSTSVGTAFILAYLKWFKTAPDEFMGYRNLVTEVIKGNIPPVFGREVQVQKIIDQLLANNTTHVHPIILGETGVGKTVLINALAWRLAKGVPGLPSKLFSIPASDLMGEFVADTKLQEIKASLDGQPAIIFLDEIHTPFMKKGADSEKFKPLFNPGQGNFKYCIGATTEAEYELHIKPDSALKRRFNPISLESISDNQTFGVLSDMIQTEAAGLIVDPKAIHKLATLREDERFKGVAQPFTSKSILALAVAKAYFPRSNDMSSKRSRLEDRKRVLECEQGLTTGAERFLYTEQGKQRAAEIRRIANKIVGLEEQMEQQKKELESFSALLQKEHQRRTTEQWAALPLTRAIGEKNVTDRDLISFILCHHYLGNALQALIEEKKAQHPDAYTINMKLIDELLDEHAKKTTSIAPPSSEPENKPFSWLHLFSSNLTKK